MGMRSWLDFSLRRWFSLICCAAVGAELVLQEDGECLVSQGTQTGEGNNLVQITASLPEVLGTHTSLLHCQPSLTGNCSMILLPATG